MHFGLNSLFKEMVNAQQAAYREDTRARLDNLDAPKAVPKAVGIGARQPNKEALQMELMRCVRSRSARRRTGSCSWLIIPCFATQSSSHESLLVDRG
jgi:hypothetical protein